MAVGNIIRALVIKSSTLSTHTIIRISSFQSKVEGVTSFIRCLDNLTPRQLTTMRTQPLTLWLGLEIHTTPVEPLMRTVVVIAGNHIAKGHALAHTIDLCIVFLALGIGLCIFGLIV